MRPRCIRVDGCIRQLQVCVAGSFFFESDRRVYFGYVGTYVYFIVLDN